MRLIGAGILAALVLAGCGERGEEVQATMPPTAEAVSSPPVMEVTARGLTFEAPDTVPAGWVTIRLNNVSSMVHFAVVEKLPPGKTLADQQAEVAEPFQEGMNLLAAGDPNAAMAAFGSLPDWFPEILFTGGPGLTGGGQSSEVTLFLEPGSYLLECYVKSGGIFHSYNPDPATFGMMHAFEVVPSDSAAEPPSPDVRLSISAGSGISVDGEMTVGSQIVEVLFEDQTVHENFVGHDVHLARLSGDGASDEALIDWMDWRRPDGLSTPAPVTFLGGSNEMPAGSRTYLNVTLEPGRYAWTAEVPDSDAKGMFKVFEVTR